MDFPPFHLDFFGNRTLIGVIAVLHVLINHAMAVGAVPLIVAMEWWGHRTGREEWDRLAYKVLAVCFIVTTSVGALTGVGIWLSSSLVNPAAIGSLIRVFFWAWFTEWIVFVIEVGLILAYFLTWKRWTPGKKRLHIALGVTLAVASWLTMAIIVAILGFMMDTGNWVDQPSLLSGVLNPIYIPQLMFRTPLAMAAAGFFALFLAYFFVGKGDGFRSRAVRFISLWILFWTPLCLAGAWYYRSVVPESMVGNLPVALGTQAFEQWYDMLEIGIAVSIAVILFVALWGLTLPRWLPRVALIVPFVLAIGLIGYFERVREFVRKPDVIAGYMYANGIRRVDYPLLAEQGLLAHATYTPVREVTPENQIVAGQAMFELACTRCHTTRGVNSVLTKLSALYGDGPWDAAAVGGYLRTMHSARPFMPPVPGTPQELDALVAYLIWLRENPVPLDGAQVVGATLADEPAGPKG